MLDAWTPDLASAEALIAGRLAETTPGWLPRLSGPPDPLEPADPGLILHVLKSSVPEAQSGYTLRSQYSLLSQRAAGLRPVAVTSLGFPRRTMPVTPDPEIAAVELVDEIEHYRLDAGPDYPYDGPVDRVLLDTVARLEPIVRELRPAILQAHSGYRGYENALVALALGEHLGLPVVYEVRGFLEAIWSVDTGSAEVDGLVSEQSERRSATEVRCMLASDAVVTIAETMRDEIVGRGVPAGRVHVIPNGVDVEAFRPAPPSPELRERYHLPPGRPTFGYISTLDHPREGVEVMISATAALLRRGRHVSCLVVGEGRRRQALEELADRQGVRDLVVFTGQVPHGEIAAHYALLDVFVVPRRDDRAARFVTPLKPFEAMAMARPIVVSALPALLELIDDPAEPRGLAFPVDDAEGLAAAIERLLDDPDLARRLGEAGRSWVAAERTWAANGPRYRAVYDEVLERFSSAAASRP
jgi:glycosyltransferase involved in cell wall biosynthesis